MAVRLATEAALTSHGSSLNAQEQGTSPLRNHSTEGAEFHSVPVRGAIQRINEREPEQQPQE